MLIELIVGRGRLHVVLLFQPQVFEVCMSADNRIEARAPVPGRLKVS